jgi:hypothetical protein
MSDELPGSQPDKAGRREVREYGEFRPDRRRLFRDVMESLWERITSRPRRRSVKIQVYIYLDTDDKDVSRQIFEWVDRLVDLLGYAGPFRVRIERGSFKRKSIAKEDKGLAPAGTSSEYSKS